MSKINKIHFYLKFQVRVDFIYFRHGSAFTLYSLSLNEGRGTTSFFLTFLPARTGENEILRSIRFGSSLIFSERSKKGRILEHSLEPSNILRNNFLFFFHYYVPRLFPLYI